MPKIIDLIHEAQERGTGPFIAFEYFPPRTDAGVANLYARLDRMAEAQPLYMDFTWGAGGSTSDLTLELSVEAKKRCKVETNMHLTCTNMPEEKLTTALDGAKAAGVHNIVALRGDPPVGKEVWEAVEGGFACALDLVKYIRANHGDAFCISVAGYPEGHPNAIKPVPEGQELTPSEAARLVETEEGRFVCSDEDYERELAYLKQKVDAGAEFIITQMFFDVDCFLNFVRDCRAKGIHCPIVPGIMCIQNARGFKRMTSLCRTRVPADLAAEVEACGDDDAKAKQVGVQSGVSMCRKLLDAGVPGLHFYTLNLEKVVFSILNELGLRSIADQDAAARPDADTGMAKGTILEG